MSDMYLAENAIQTYMLLPVVVIALSIVISYLMSFFSYKKANRFLTFGLICGVISMAVAWAFVFITLIATV